MEDTNQGNDVLRTFTQYRTPWWAYLSLAFGILVILTAAFFAVYAYTSDRVSIAGKTWMQYPDVQMTLVENRNCENCGNDQIAANVPLTIGPSVNVKRVGKNSLEGQKLIDTYDVKVLPYVVLSEGVEQMPKFAQFSQGLSEHKDGSFGLSALAMRTPNPEVITTPQVKETDARFGPDDAELTIFEFSDFQCPYCLRAMETVKKIQEEYSDRVQLVFKHMPIESIHPNAMDAAKAAVCARKQDAFWEMHDRLFANQDVMKNKSFGRDTLVTWAEELRLDTQSFTSCLDEESTKQEVQNDLELARAYGITGTPAFFVGDTLLNGAYPYEQMKQLIDQKLAAQNETSETGTEESGTGEAKQ